MVAIMAPDFAGEHAASAVIDSFLSGLPIVGHQFLYYLFAALYLFD